MKIKRLVSAALALTMCFTLFGCSDSNSESDESVKKESIKVDITQAANDIASIPDDAEKTLKWMGTYDLNPTTDQEKSVQMSLFEKKGGKVEWQQVSDSEKFDKLASTIVSGKDVPDIFRYEWQAFPQQTLKGMYQPITSLVDFEKGIWADVKNSAENFSLNGEYYVAPIDFTVGTLMIYDAKKVEDEGITDPYNEYLNGNWNWDTFRDICQEYKNKAKSGEDRFGLAGWFGTQFIQQSGQTMVTYDNKTNTLTSNLDNPDIERAEKFLYDCTKDGIIDTTWYNTPQSAFNSNVLFYNMGVWAMTGNSGPTADDNWQVVPVPSDPNTDESYVSSDMLAYMWVKGSTSKEAVKCWLECARVSALDPTYQKTEEEKFLADNPGWTSDMYAVYTEASSTKHNQVFDYGYGMSDVMSSDSASSDGNCVTRKLYEYVTKLSDDGVQFTWSSLKNSYKSTVESEVKQVNKQLADFTNK